MNTSWEFLLNLKEKGRAIADQWIKDDYDQLGLRSTFDVEEHFFGKL
jgi:NTE family protein